MRKLLSLLLIAALLCSCNAASAWGESSAEQYENAIELLRENKYTEAGEAFAALGSYSDSPRYTMYCNAIAAGEAGLYGIAVGNLQSLNGFLDSSLLATYYAGLSWEACEDYERAAEVLKDITLYRDVTTRIAGYPALIDARDYRKADENEKAGNLEAALSGFNALGAYQDSADRAQAVREKIHARDYAAADTAEQQNKLEEALAGFKALGSYSDSAARAAAVQKKMDERDAAAAEQAKADAYAKADQAEKDGDYAAAYAGFAALADYKDSADRAAAVQDKGNYAQAVQYAMKGQFAQAYKLFIDLGDYEDSAEKAYTLGVTNFATVSDRKNGIAAFEFHDLWGLININTNATVSPFWDEIGQFNSFGLAPVTKNNLHGYINTAGEVVVPCEWYSVSEFNENGLCTVVKKESTESTWSTYDYYYFGLYDSAGRVITPATWRTLGDSTNYNWGESYNIARISAPKFSDGKTKVQNADGLYGFIDNKGNLVGEVRWSSIRDFSENLAVVVENDKYGFIDKSGNVVIQPQYTDALPFSENLAGVKTDTRWQFIDHENNVVIQPKYSEVSSFSKGLADVFLPETGWQIIDATGGLIYFINEKTVEAYDAAKAQFDAGNFDAAYAAFLELAGYKDADELAAESGYQSARLLMERKEYAKAASLFAALNGYKDSDELSAQAQALVPDYVTVENVPGTSYGFALNPDGWYESQNKHQGKTYAICIVKFVTTSGKFTMKVVNDGERGFDFGMISYLDTRLSNSRLADSGVYKSYAGGNTSGVDTITFDVPDQKEHFIYIKYIKDSNGNAGSDTIKFKFE